MCAAAVAAVAWDDAELVLQRGLRAYLVGGRGLPYHHRLRGRAVEGARAEGEVVRDRDLRRVAGHHEVVRVHEAPLGHQVGRALGGVVEQRLGDVAGLLRRDQCAELGLPVEDVPAGELVVLRVPGRHRVQRLVEAHVLAIAVADHVRVLEHVVERGVEQVLLAGRTPGDLDLVEQRVPGVVRVGPYRVEVEAGTVLGLPVGAGVRVTDEGDADLGLDHPVGGGVERQEHRVRTGLYRRVGRERLVEDDVEVHGVRVRGAAEMSTGRGTAHLVRTYDRHRARRGAVLAVPQLDQQIGLARTRERPAGHAAARRGGQLGPDGGPRTAHHRVVPGLGDLPGVGERFGVRTRVAAG